MIVQVIVKDIAKILTVFSLSPGSRFNRNLIKEKTLLNNIPLDKSLNFLLQTGLIKKEKRLYSLDLNNRHCRKILELISAQYKELKEIPFKVYFVIVDLLHELSSYKQIELYLFGSYSKLIYTEKSDIDIALLSAKKHNISKIVNKLEGRYNVSIEIHYFNQNEFYKNKKDPLIKDILNNGIKII